MSKGGNGPKETAEERELAKIGLEEYERWNSGGFKDLENYLIKQMTGEEETAAFRSEALGVTAADTNIAFDQGEGMLEDTLAARGARPGSGAFGLSEADLSIKRGEALGTGLARTNSAVNDRESASLEALLALGRGQATQAIGGLTDVAGIANQDAILDAQAAAAARAQMANVIGAGAGFTASMYNPAPPGVTQTPATALSPDDAYAVSRGGPPG